MSYLVKMHRKVKRDNLNHLIAGFGEVGTGIGATLYHVTNVWAIDKREYPPYPDRIDILHICFPYDGGGMTPLKFIGTVKKYQKRFNPKYTIIHSTVPIGVSKALGATHSPVRGTHPRLDRGIKSFVKYFGGKNAGTLAAIFRRYGWSTIGLKESDWTEALKLWDTTQYGIMIMLEKEIHAWCKKKKIPFDIVYQHANRTYNEGYAKLKRPEVARPFLKHIPGRIGGHCVIPNAKLLNSAIAKLLVKFDNAIRGR